jgi:hypothetical protein
MLRPRPFSSPTAGLTLVLAAAVGALAPSTAAADRVVLVNGQVFEDVSAELREATVSIRVGGGALTLPRDQVLRIEAGPSTLEEYGRRRASLRVGGAPASQWLELARWAREHAFDFGARESALVAAELDPGLDGLGGLLRTLGYERDGAEGGWLPFAEAMRRRGWVEDGGEWVPATVAQARARARIEELAERRRAADGARLERLAALTELRLTADLMRPEPTAAQGVAIWPIWSTPILVPVPAPGQAPPPPPQSPAPPAQRPPARPTHNGILDRQPGSLIPIAPPR